MMFRVRCVDMGLDIFSGGHPFHLFEHLAEIEGALKAQPVRHLIDLKILLQKQSLCPGYLFLGNVLGKAHTAGFLKQDAQVIGTQTKDGGDLI